MSLLPTDFEFHEDKDHVYFITFPYIIQECMPGALPGNGVVNKIDICLPTSKLT